MTNKRLPAYLEYRWSCYTWDIGGTNETRSEQGEFELKLGPARSFEGFGELSICEITPQRIVVRNGHRSGEVTPNSPLVFSYEDEGIEDHEGILWGSDEYTLRIAWPE